MTDFHNIERILSELQTALAGHFSGREKDEVWNFIEHGEYGLALETIADIVEFRSLSVPPRALELTRAAAAAMDVDIDEIERRMGLR